MTVRATSRATAALIRRAIVFSGVVAAVATVATPGTASALTIVPHFGTGSAAFSAADLGTLNTAINFYETTFSDPITVDIGFFQSTDVGLGQSETLFYGGAGVYPLYYTALAADATSSDDATALASLTGVSSPGLILSSANCRAVDLGCDALPGIFSDTDGNCQITDEATTALDGCVGVNTTLTGFGPTKYSLLAVLEHEIDEVLGNGSALFPGGHDDYIHPMDLFRYSAPGVRDIGNHGCSTAEPYGPPAYMSFDNGVTDLAPFNNCDNGGDYGDYAPTATPQVQDAFGTPGGTEHLTAGSVEVRGLDVIGYTLASPEPATLGLLATGFIGLAGIARRRKNS